MPYLVDTNILVRVTHRSDPQRRLAWRALTNLWSRGETLYYTSQILGELWNVCTRPTQARGGLGLTVEQIDRRVRLFERNLELLSDSPTVHEEWRRLLVAHAVSGVQVHDARLVAAMHVYGVPHLLTFNGDYFRRHARITLVHPEDITSRLAVCRMLGTDEWFAPRGVDHRRLASSSAGASIQVDRVSRSRSFPSLTIYLVE